MMDVKCDQCQTEYEFERERVPQEGLSVKCSHCGHVFMVYRQGGENKGEVWRVRQPNGSVFEFKELTTLQRWIVERKVSRSDEISKSGKNWKRLGDIAELATFFQVVDQAASSSPAAPVQPVALSHPVSPPAPAANYVSAVSPLAPPIAAPQQAPPAPPQSPAPAPNSIAHAGEPAFTQSSGMGIEAHSTDEFDDEFDFPRRGQSLKRIFLFLLFLALLGGGAAIVKPELLETLLGSSVPELALTHVYSGYTQLDRDSHGSLQKALGEFNKALALAPNYPDALAGISEAELALAENANHEAEALSQKLKKPTSWDGSSRARDCKPA